MELNTKKEQDIIYNSDLGQVGGFIRVFRFPSPRYNWNIVESGIKHYKTNYSYNILVCVQILLSIKSD